MDDIVWTRKPHGSGRIQTYPAVALMSALRPLAVGISPLSMVKEFGISRQSMDVYFERFCRAMFAKYAEKYLKPDWIFLIPEHYNKIASTTQDLNFY